MRTILITLPIHMRQCEQLDSHIHKCNHQTEVLHESSDCRHASCNAEIYEGLVGELGNLVTSAALALFIPTFQAHCVIIINQAAVCRYWFSVEPWRLQIVSLTTEPGVV